MVGVRGDVQQPDAVLTGDDFCPLVPPPGNCGRRGELEVGVPGVVDHVQPVTGRLDAVLEALHARDDQQGSAGGRAGVEEMDLTRGLADAVDDEPAVVAGPPGRQPEALVVLAQDVDVVSDRRPQRVPAQQVGAPGVVEDRVRDVVVVDPADAAHVLELVGQLVARGQVPEACPVQLLTGGVGAP